MEATDSTLNDNFEPIEYEDPKKEESIFEIFKAKDWDTTVPHILESIERSRDTNSSYGDYPYFKIQNTCNFVPKLSAPSEILNELHLKELHSRLPYYLQYLNFKLVYSLSKDGSLLKTFYQKNKDINNSIIVVKDDNGNVFGAFATEMFHNKSDFYGTGETFLFTFYNGTRIHVFNSTGKNEHYIYSDNKQLCFGCSDNYFSLALENDFYEGYSKTTQTFNNQILNRGDKFIIIKLECWTFLEK